MLVALSCKKRGVCPSCNARRMCGTAAHLTMHVLPDTPLRQWVLSVPFELRLLLARDPRALTAVGRIFVQEIFRWQRESAGMAGLRRVQGGAICFPQRFGGSLNLNVHYHVAVPDGVFTIDKGSERAGFHRLPKPDHTDLDTLAFNMEMRVTAWLRRRGLLRDEGVDTGDDTASRSALDACLEGSLGLGELTALPAKHAPPLGAHDMALRFESPLFPGRVMPAAGLPWFMSMFGRDSLITSLQALPFTPQLARATLETLAALQARTVDPFRDAEPGKILHELRLGEMTAFEERPHSPYYGSADSTPLFLILLDEYEKWSGDREFVRGLESEVRAAIKWMNEYGDRDQDGYIEYSRHNVETGLENMCWKDSWDSIAFANGELAPLPRATCELQGYAYDAKRRVARLARLVYGDEEWARSLDRQADQLKSNFNQDFWIPERGFFALALDGRKRKVDSLTSNIGHLLWSGIADPEKAKSCVKHLMSDALFSGWGVRTMAVGEGSYNPIGYHVGTVWPHDSSIVAWGLRRYGYREEAARIGKAILEASVFFRHRLPEAFAGFPRAATRFPVEYPTACSPQAWATAAPLLILRALLGLDVENGRLLVDPAIPHPLEQIELLDIPGAWGRADAFGRAHLDVAA
jgi:glycogen debranching enzyme